MITEVRIPGCPIFVNLSFAPCPLALSHIDNFFGPCYSERTLIFPRFVMKKDIHPKVSPVVFVDTSCGAQFVTTSSLKSNEKMDINGVSHMIVNVEISSASHPFYTGKQILVDTARRVEKFHERFGKQVATADSRKGKRVKRAAKAEKKSNESAETK